MSASPKSQTLLTAEEFWELPELPHGGPGGDAHTYSGASVLSSADAGFLEDGFELDLAELFAE